MPSELSKKGLEKGLITQKQYDKLPAHLLDAIVKSKMKKKGMKMKDDKKSKPKYKKKGETKKDKGKKGKK